MKKYLFDLDFHRAEREKFYSAKLVRTPGMANAIAKWCAVIFIILILALFFPWTQNITTNGVLTTLNPQERPQTVHSTIAGRIERWHVQEGQLVKKGDTLVSLSEVKEKFFDPNLLFRINEQVSAKENALRTTKDKAKALESQIGALKSGLEYSLSKARNKVKQSQLKVKSDSMDLVAIKMENEIAQAQFARQEKLYSQGLKSLTELEQKKMKLQETSAKLMSVENKYLASSNELINSRIELQSIQAEYLDKISKAESEWNSTLSYIFNTDGEISKMRNEYSNMMIRNSFYQIVAPQDGFVVKALKQGLGEMVKEGEPIISIITATPHLAAAIYVKPMDIPLLQKGRKVRIQFDGWPALVFTGWPNQSFGTFGGIVKVIDNIDSEGKYRLLVTPDPNDLPWPAPLRVGSGVYAWIMLNDVPIWYEIWRQLNGFPPDFVESLDIKKTKESKMDKIDKDKNIWAE